MEWFNEFTGARNAGNNTFLFTGNTGDSFPLFDKIPHEYPVDRLDPLAEICAQHVANGNVICIFDPARGFIFPREADEETVQKIVGRQETRPDTSGLSAIERAAAKVHEKARLPKRPMDAFGVIFDVLNATANRRKPLPCIVIIPDVDTIMPRASREPLLALLVIRFAQTYEYQRAGHILIMTAPSASSVDERLTGVQSPVTHITINRPTLAERLHYLSCICVDAKMLHQRARDKEQELETLIEEERVRLEFAICDAEARRAAHQEQKAAALASHPLYKRAAKAMQRAQKALEGAREASVRRAAEAIRTCDREIEEIDQQLKEDPACQDTRLTDKTWKKLREDDIIRWSFVHVVNDKPHARVSEYRVKKIHRDGHIELSQPLPHGAKETFCDEKGAPVQFSMKHNKLIAENSTRGIIKFPSLTPVFEIVSPLKRELHARRERHEMKRVHIAQTEFTDEATTKLETAVERAELEQKNAEREALQEWLQDDADMELSIRELREHYEHPATPLIAAARTELKRLKAHIAQTKHATVKPFELTEPEIETAARLTQGCGYRDILGLLKQARANGERFNARLIRERSIRIIKKTYADMLEIVEPAYGWEGIAGLETVRRELDYVKNRILAGDYKRVPQGIILMGPPGTGKTALAEAWARECDMLFVKLKNLKEPWVGTTEQRTDMAQQALLDLAPCIVFKDEADQMDQGRDAYQGDSGVSNYQRRAWMEFESRQDIRGRVIILKGSNRPDLIDAALLRDQRTDERFPILMPDARTRRCLFETMARREGFDLRVDNLDPFVQQTDGLSGANIQKIIRHADRAAGRRGISYIDDAALRAAMDDFIPESTQHDIALMSLIAIETCSARHYLPDNVEELKAKYMATLGITEKPEKKDAVREFIEKHLKERKEQ